MSGKFERELARFRQQQQEASKQLEKKEAPKKPKKEPTPAVVRAAPPPAENAAVRARRATPLPVSPSCRPPPQQESLSPFSTRRHSH